MLHCRCYYYRYAATCFDFHTRFRAMLLTPCAAITLLILRHHFFAILPYAAAYALRRALFADDIDTLLRYCCRYYMMKKELYVSPLMLMPPLRFFATLITPLRHCLRLFDC